MNGLYLLHFGCSEPVGVAIDITVAKTVSKAIVKPIIEAVIKVITETITGLRQIDYHIKRQGTAEFFIEQAHTLVNFSALTKVVDKTVFYPQLAQANQAE